MSLEIYWKKALEQTRLSIDDESLYPLKTEIITNNLYEKDDFIIRKLDTSKFNKKKIYGPKQNPFCPWEKICLDRWKQALLDGLAPKVILESTNIVVLESVPLEKLKEYQFNKK